jgi:hypothetical protein
MTLLLEALVVLAAVVTVDKEPLITQLPEPSILAGAVVAGVIINPENQAAQALSLSKYLTTYPQHSLAALHLACPHPVGSTSTL